MLVAERDECLDLVLSTQDLESGDSAVQQLMLCDAQTLSAAHEVLEAPVHNPADLYAKYDTIILHEEFYLEQAALLKPLLRRIRQDARSMMADTDAIVSAPPSADSVPGDPGQGG